MYYLSNTFYCLHINQKAHMACKFNCLFENEGLLKVTGSYVHCKCGNISETVQDRVVFTINANAHCPTLRLDLTVTSGATRG